MRVSRILPPLCRQSRRHALRNLEKVRRRAKDVLTSRRARTVELYIGGQSTWEIAAALGCAPATCVRTLHLYRDRGLDGLLDGRRENGLRKIDDDALQALAEILDRTPDAYGWPRPTWTLGLLVKELARRTGLTVSTATMARAMTRLGARWGMPKPIVLCPWPRSRKQRRMQAIRRMLRQLGPNESAWYVDEVDIHLNPKIGRDWMHCGTQRVVPTPGKNQKRYLAGALAADGSDLVVVEAEKKTTDLFLRLLNALLKRCKGARRIHLVLDNYCIHSSHLARTYLAHCGDRIQLHFLPPYSPDENKIERLWRELHANVTRNHRCRTMAALMRNVRAWIARESRRRRRTVASSSRTRRRRQNTAGRRAAA